MDDLVLVQQLQGVKQLLGHEPDFVLFELVLSLGLELPTIHVVKHIAVGEQLTHYIETVVVLQKLVSL